MKHLASLPFALMAAPALAHDGPHLHPHDSGTWLVLVLLLAIGALVLIRVIRKRSAQPSTGTPAESASGTHLELDSTEDGS